MSLPAARRAILVVTLASMALAAVAAPVSADPLIDPPSLPCFVQFGQPGWLNPPAAHDDSYNRENGDLSGTSDPTFLSVHYGAPGVLANDGSGSLHAAIYANPSHAKSFSLHADGSFDYVPVDGYFGSDSFQYVNYFVGGPCSTGATVTIEAATKMRAQDDFYSTPIDTTLYVGNVGGQIAICSGVNVCGVLNNEINRSGDASVASGVVIATDGKLTYFHPSLATTKTAHGTATFRSDGSLTYTPDSGFQGTDTFGYSVPTTGANAALAPHHDVQLNLVNSPVTFDWATVTVDVFDPPPPAIAKGIDDEVQATEDTTLHIEPGTLLANDLNTFYITFVNEQNFGTQTLRTAHGSMLVTYQDLFPGIPSLRVTSIDYTPDPDFSGVDTFTYRVAQSYTNGWDTSDFPGRVYLLVAPVDDPPTATQDNASTDQDVAITVNAAANDSDPDGNLDPASLSKDGDPCTHQPVPHIPNCGDSSWDNFLHGTWVTNGDGTLTYTPTPGFVGTAQFPYRIADSQGQGDWSRVLVTVRADTPPSVFVNSWCDLSGGGLIICPFSDNRFIVEGGTAQLNGSIDDPEFQPGNLVVTWGDGSTTTAHYPCDGEAGCPFGTTPTYSSLCVSAPGGPPCADLYFHLEHTYTDDPAGSNDHYSISATVTETQNAGKHGQATTGAYVANVDPTLTIASDCPLCIGSYSSLNPAEGSPVVVAGRVSDPGQDTGTLSIDWGDGGPATTVAMSCGPAELCPTPALQAFGCALSLFPGTTCGVFSQSHTYPHPGTFTITVSATDDDAGTDTATLTATVAGPPDATDPTISAIATTADAAAYTAGTWTNQAVTVHFDCADDSGSVTCPSDVTVSTDGVTASVPGTASDGSGNTASTSFGPIWIDATAPTISASATTADLNPYVAGTSTNQTVTIHYDCSDIGGSGVASCPADQVFGTTGSSTASGTATDNAGNTSTATFGSVVIAKTAPSISASAKTADNAAYAAGSWTNQTVTVHFACSDNSGTGLAGCTSDQTYSSNGVSTANGTVTDNVGNTASTSFGPVRIDKTKPTISASAKTADGHAYVAGTTTNQTVTVHYACSDAGGSGLATCPADQVFNTNGTSTASGSASDNAGNSSTATFGQVKIAKPVLAVSFGNTCPPGQIAIGAKVSVTWTVSGVGPADLIGPAKGTIALDTSTPGAKSVTKTATSRSGSSAQAVCSYQVGYRVALFAAPGRLPDWKAGKPALIVVALANDKGQLLQACPGCSVSFQAVKVLDPRKGTSSGQAIGPVAMTFDTRLKLYAYSWNLGSAAVGTGKTQLLATVTYPDGTKTTVSMFVDIKK